MNVDPGEREFDRFAENYDRALAEGLSLSGESREYFAIARVELLKKSLQALRFFPTAVMDFGCGDGSSTPLLLAIPGVQQVVGIDISPASIRHANDRHARPNLSFQTADQCPENNFDLVYCNGVFHHIRPASRAQAMSFLFKSLRPGGLLSLWENNPWNPGTRWVMSRIPFDKDAITLSCSQTVRMLRGSGFQILSTQFAFYFPRALSFLRFSEPFLRKIPLGAQYTVLARKLK